MSTPTNRLLESVFRGVIKGAEANLKLQHELLAEWTRYWPGFSRRVTAQPLGIGDLSEQWSNAMLTAVRTQRDLVNQQFNAAFEMFDMAAGTVTKGQELVPPARSQPAVAASQPSVAPTEPPSGLKESKPTAPSRAPATAAQRKYEVGPTKNIRQKVAVVTGAASGIGEAVARELAARGATAVLLVDRSEAVGELAESINKTSGREVADPLVGDTTDEAFRQRVYNHAEERYGLVTICIPAAGITRDALSVRVNSETGKAEIYPIETFRQVTEVNLLAPIYWGMEMVARIAQDRRQRGLKRWEPEETIQGAVVFLGSVSSQGNKGQISYATAKAGLEGAAATLTKEAIFHGVRCAIIHPGFTDTPMARALGDDFLNQYVLPYTQLRRLIQPEEIADAICFMVSNSAVSGELWADAGWHPPA